jgi:hypothetical protein
MPWLQSVGWFFSFNPRALIFDVAVLGGNLFLLDRLAQIGEDGTDRQVGVLLAAALISQLLGALIKVRPLRARLYEEKIPATENRTNVIGCLAFTGFILYIVIAAMALALLGVLSPVEAGGDTPDFIWIGASAVIGFLIASVVWYAASPPKHPLASRPWHPVVELAADILLYCSALIITALFWSSWQQLVAPGFGAGISIRALILVLGSSVIFFVFYIPPRLLYMVEDYDNPLAWLRMWLVMLPLAWQVVGG